MTRLTEATYRLEVRYRSTGRRVPSCSFDGQRIEASFNRVLDGQSSADVLVLSASEDGMCAGGCSSNCPCLPLTRKHELAFIRDDDDEPAWIGPIDRVGTDGTTGALQIGAVDRSFWWEGAPFNRAIVGNFTIDELWRRYHDQAVEYEDDKLQRLDRFVAASPNDKVVDHREGDEINGEMLSLAQSLLDYTIAGERLYYGAPEIPISDGPAIISSRDLGGDGQISVDTDGGEAATRVRFVGANGVTAVYPEVERDLGWGKRTNFAADTNVDDPDEALARAKAIFEANREPQTFLVTGGNTLSAGFPGTLRTLVPGRYFPVRADTGCNQTGEERRRLGLVNVNIESVNDRGRWQLKERRVAVDFSPADTAATAQAVSV